MLKAIRPDFVPLSNLEAICAVELKKQGLEQGTLKAAHVSSTSVANNINIG